MSFGADCLINKLNTSIVSLSEDNKTSIDFGQISGALNSLENSFCSVATLNDLPTACDNIGRFIYVQSIEAFRYSDGYDWLMNACSVLGNVNTATALWTWGFNTSGRLGDGTIVNRCSPGTIFGGGTNWCQVSSGTANSFAIKTDGTLWSWGCNNCGQLGDGTTVSRLSPGTIFGGGTTWSKVTSNCLHTVALKSDGTLWTWGSNTSGRLGDGTTVSRCSPGTTWGSFTNWCDVSASNYHSSAIKTDGTLWTWGCNNCGQLGDGTTVSRCSPGTIFGGGTWCEVSVGGFHMAAIKTDGTLWTWGCNLSGQLGDGTTVSRCSPGTIFGGGTNWCQVSAAPCHITVIKTDGTLWTWGANISGRLGDGTTVSRCSPGTVFGGGTTWCQVSGGYGHNAAIKTDGTLWTWGNNGLGRLGAGTQVTRCSPGTIVGGATTWCQVSVGSYHTSALKSRGF